MLIVLCNSLLLWKVGLYFSRCTPLAWACKILKIKPLLTLSTPGSGKTHTMQGPIDPSSEYRGIIPRSMEQVFKVTALVLRTGFSTLYNIGVLSGVFEPLIWIHIRWLNIVMCWSEVLSWAQLLLVLKGVISDGRRDGWTRLELRVHCLLFGDLQWEPARSYQQVSYSVLLINL